jgi:anaerobic nitric oxide reductase flavorubredoxin
MNTTLCENIDWVGVIDWEIRDFHGYDAQRGATYNAYLVRDEKTALIDAVKGPFSEQLLRNIQTHIDPSKVDYVVCNHAELDHAGGLPDVLRAMPQATLVCNKKCAAVLGQLFDTSGWKIRTVAAGDVVSLGRRTLEFIETPMFHWPESMFTYVPQERLLFSMDAFGQHYATAERFDDEVDLGILMDEVKIYYANIIMPYPSAVLGALERMSQIQIDMIAPSHGLIWRRHGAEVVAAYRDWATHRCKPKVLVVYDTMWENTAAMAEAIVEGASQPGIITSLVPIRHSSLTHVAAEVLDAAAVAMGSSTLNRGMMPMVAAALSYLQGLRPQNKAAMSFGSYGWGQGGPEGVDQALRGLGWDVVREPLRARNRPTPAVLDECREAGKLLAERAGVLAAR